MKLPSHVKFHLPRSKSHRLDAFAERGADVVQQATRTLAQRSSTSSTAETSCSPGNSSPGCQKPVSSESGILPIVVGAVIPITCAIIVLFFLHRRLNRKQRQEDANDPHKSLDFGVDISMGPSKSKRGKRGLPEMTISDLSPDPMRPGKGDRGLSMNIDSPYLLPSGLHGSRESIHSMSRSIHDEHDPYRPVTFARSIDNESLRSPRFRNDDGSIYSASTMNTSNENSNLLANAQLMSQSHPRQGNALSPQDSNSGGFPPHRPQDANDGASAGDKASVSEDTSISFEEESGPLPLRKNSLPPLPPPPPPPEPESEPDHLSRPVRASAASFSGLRPPRKDSAAAAAQRSQAAADAERPRSDGSYYGDEPVPPLPEANVLQSDANQSHQPHSPHDAQEPQDQEYDIDPSMIYTGRFSIDTPTPSQQFPVQEQRASIMGLRPLPPDNPEENAEQRANRIRSFYKEYFDDSKPNPANGQYGEDDDYDMDFLGGAIYDPETGAYVYAGEKPFAQAPGRRAMTPPPGGARMGPGAHGRHFSTMSGGRGRPGGRMPVAAPKKKLPPPKPLTSLPTPHLLTPDIAVMSPIDFAPPTSFRETRNGRRPDSPMGVQRPYSPAVRSYSPLVASSSELSVMPSPHHLRKSGTFTALDFAAPRFRGQEGGASDAGSIRSARSGISAVQLDAVRAGAYRVSRIPSEMVTTRDDLALQLKPTMNLTRPA